MSNLPGQKQKFVDLSKAMYKSAPQDFITIKPGEPGWTDWMSMLTGNK